MAENKAGPKLASANKGRGWLVWQPIFRSGGSGIPGENFQQL